MTRPDEPQWGQPYTDALQAEVRRLREELDTTQRAAEMTADAGARWKERAEKAEEQLDAARQQRDEWHSGCNEAQEQLDALQKEHDWVGALNEQNDRLVRQLEAARQALAPFVTRGSGPDRPARAPTWEVGGQYVVWLEKGEWERARAALGVEGPAAE